ncbi:unnamed protein product [Fusarium graminearum]|nr:unnamed protein product [Fusarium graminearum]
MERYGYSKLAEGSIRLLRLLPDQDKQSQIQCQLFEFALLNSHSTCPYEALSYVWGFDNKPCSITVNSGDLRIGSNLHAALSSLRHSTLERIIWIDALCINQDDMTEKGQQVQSMAKIYAKANCVIVWLGEAADESDRALLEICGAAVESPTNQEDPQKIFSLLSRPWFQRIWVLQEVAAARHVLIKCGSTEIDGYAFCSGLSALKLSYDNFERLRPLVTSVTYLIRGAILRPRHTGPLGGRFSLNIRPLSELVEMYHTRKATERRDKVYALLGMSSDDPTTAGLSIDYTLPWSQVFESLIKYTLSHSLSVKTWDDKEIAVIRSKGLVLGEVCLVERDHDWEDSQKVGIAWKHIYFERYRTSVWKVQASAKSIKEGDVVCLFQEAKNPTIIRPCGSFWVVIMISLPTGPIQQKNTVPQNEVRLNVDQFRSATCSRDLVLIWDWDTHSIESLNNEERRYENLVLEQFENDSLMEELHKIAILANMGLVLRDLHKHAKSEDCIRKVLAIFETTIKNRKDASNSNDCKTSFDITSDMEGIVKLFLHIKGGWLPLQWASEDGHDAIVKQILQKADPNMVDEEGRTPLSWASEKGFGSAVKVLLGTGAVDPDARDKAGWTPLLWAAKNGHEEIVKLLLSTKTVDPDAKEGNDETRGTRRTPLLLASEAGHMEVVRLLLETHKVDLGARDESGGTSLMWAVKNGHTDVVRLLLQTGKIDPNASEEGEVENEGGRTPLMWAASNGNEEIVRLLLNTRRVKSGVREKSSRTAIAFAAESGHGAIVKLLLSTIRAGPDVPDKDGRTPLMLAAEGGFEEIVQLLLHTNKVDINSKDKRGRTPLFLAAKNGHEHIVNILAERNELTYQELQRQVPITSNHEDFLHIRDDDYFEDRCKQLFSDVQHWVTRFSRAGDMRTSRRRDEIDDDVVDNLEAMLINQLDERDDDPAPGLPAHLTSGINDEKIIDRLDNVVLDGTDVDIYLSDRSHRRDVFTAMIMNMIWEFIFTRYLFGLDRHSRQLLKSLERQLAGPPEAGRKWRAITLTLLSQRETARRQLSLDAEAVTNAIFQTVCAVLSPPTNIRNHLRTQLQLVVLDAAELSIEMRTQKAEYMMLPPLHPEYDTNGDLAAPIIFNADMMNECSARTEISNEDLQAHEVVVRMALFPLLVKKGGDDGVGDEEIVVFPTQVLIAPQDTDEAKVMAVPDNSVRERGLEVAAFPADNISLVTETYSEDRILEASNIPQRRIVHARRIKSNNHGSGKRRLGWVREILTKVRK